jgi:hypothetical protein
MTPEQHLCRLIAVALIVLLATPLATPLGAQGPQPVIAKDGKSALYPVSTDRAFVAAVRAAASKWTVTFCDKDSGTVSFVTGHSFWNNRALQVSVTLSRVSDAETKVGITMQKQVSHGLGTGNWDKGLVQDYFVAITEQLKTVVSK